MKTVFTINKDLLLEKLSIAQRFTASRFSSTISLQAIALEGEKNTLKLYATNLNTYFYTKIAVKNQEVFKVAFEPKKTTEFLSLLSSGELEVALDDKKIVIMQGKTKGTFPLIEAQDFPLPPQIKAKGEKIPSKFLLESLPLVLFSASNDEGRPVLTGVNFLIQDGQLLLVSTDGFRLSLVKTKGEERFPQMLVPRSFLEELLKFLKEEDEVGMMFSKEEKMIAFRTKEHTLYSRLIEGEFPPFEKVIPTERKTRVVLEKDEFLRNVRLVSVFARELSNIVILKFEKEGVLFTPKTEEESQNSTLQEAEVEGEEQSVAFNFKFVLDFLNHSSAKKIEVEVLRPDAPVVFKEVGKKDFLHIIMPVRIQT